MWKSDKGGDMSPPIFAFKAFRYQLFLLLKQLQSTGLYEVKLMLNKTERERNTLNLWG
jgi:hypothetical protein